MNWRKAAYILSCTAMRSRTMRYYRELTDIDRCSDPWQRQCERLTGLLRHCQESVPYYSALMRKRGKGFEGDPREYLRDFPVLTKTVLRDHFDALAATDLRGRSWRYNTSGGSTGEPVRFIQDADYLDWIRAARLLFYSWAGKDIGESELYLWGSERDIFQAREGFKTQIGNFISNVCFLNAFRMSPQEMRRYIRVINTARPSLIIAYAQAIYELCCFAEHEGIPIEPQRAVMTSAGTLYPFMRAKIEDAFACKVFNKYGSREVGAIACECSVHQYLHVPPAVAHVEILDDNDNPVPPGTDGNIVVTSLCSYAMPLIRYKIGDRGILSSLTRCSCGRTGQLLQAVLGRNVDAFRTSDGTLIDGEYFTHLLYFRSWVKQFQVIQTKHTEVQFKIVPRANSAVDPADIREIEEKTRIVMGPSCAVDVEFVNEIVPAKSGKYRYTISKVEPS